MSQLNIILLVIGGSVLILGLFSKLLKRWGLPDPLILLLVGIALGPVGTGWLTPETWGSGMTMLIVEQAARLTLAIGLMGVALRLPKTHLLQHARGIAFLLALAMPFMWLSSSALIYVILGLPVWMALLIGAIITPTDPVVASAIVTGPVAEKYLPQRVRHILSGEAGFNDGLGYLFVLFPILMLTRPSGDALQHWFFSVLLREVFGAVVLGAIIGYGAGWLLRLAEEREFIEEPSVLAFTTALALVTLAGVKLLGSDGILAVFVCGLAFDQAVKMEKREQEKRVVEGVDRFFTLPIFVFLGLIIPWEGWLALGWPGVLLALGVLLLRRLPFFFALGGRLMDLPSLPDRIFAGWFGPIGVAALYYVALASHHVEMQAMWPVVSLLACVSIALHGLTATPFSKWYASRREKAAA